MTQMDLLTAPRETLTRKRRPSLADKLEAFLMDRTGRWVSVIAMAEVAGASGVRERRRECEQRGVWLEHPGTYQGGRYGFVVLGRKAVDSLRKSA